MKVGEDYKKKYILLEIDDKADKNILINALKGYIEKLTKDIEMYSKSEHRVDSIKICAEQMTKCMQWRDNVHTMGSDTWPRDFEFYKNGIERII